MTYEELEVFFQERAIEISTGGKGIEVLGFPQSVYVQGEGVDQAANWVELHGDLNPEGSNYFYTLPYPKKKELIQQIYNEVKDSNFDPKKIIEATEKVFGDTYLMDPVDENLILNMLEELINE